MREQVISITLPSAGELPRSRLWAECLALYAGVPVVMTALFGLYPLFPVVFALTVLALFLLGRTPGYSRRDLLNGPVVGQWQLILAFTLGCTALTFGLALALVPERLLEMPRHRPDLWLTIMLLYPLFSAIPQELIFRALFFGRYGRLFPSQGMALAANSGAFALAHLFYMNAVAISLAALGGLVFGWAYLRHGSVLLASVLHAIAGMLVFTAGLGIYFYHGAVGHAP